jgi:hypothetical protein
MVPQLRPLLVISLRCRLWRSASREFKALSAEETADLLAGRGMGAARVARALGCTGVCTGAERLSGRAGAGTGLQGGGRNGFPRRPQREAGGSSVPAGTLEEERERLAEELLRRPRRLWTSCERSRLIEKEMRRRSLFKYYSERKWAEEFLEGETLIPLVGVRTFGITRIRMSGKIKTRQRQSSARKPV